MILSSFVQQQTDRQPRTQSEIHGVAWLVVDGALCRVKVNVVLFSLTQSATSHGPLLISIMYGMGTRKHFEICIQFTLFMQQRENERSG